MSKIKVLIAEDVPTDAELAIREIKKSFDDTEIKVVDTEDDFLSALQNFNPGLIISDYEMPTFNGLQALELTLKLTPYTPFIIFTGSLNEEIAVNCMKAGATDYVLKDHIMRLGTSIKSAIKAKEAEREQFLTQQNLIIYQERLRKLTMELTLSEEKHRRKIASDLHDYISQSLVFSKIKVHELLNKISNNEVQVELKQVHELISEALQKTRNITEDLSPPVLYELGLSEGIGWLCDKISVTHNLSIEAVNKAGKINIDQGIHIIIFRIIQELLINIVKHACATEALVIIDNAENNRISFTVRDNGKGFDDEYKNNAKKSFGLFNIFEQIENLNGEIAISKSAEQGMEISFILPQTAKYESEGSIGR